MQDLASNDRAEAVQAAKLAVRAYARHPSSKNEAGVEEALRLELTTGQAQGPRVHHNLSSRPATRRPRARCRRHAPFLFLIGLAHAEVDCSLTREHRPYGSSGRGCRLKHERFT
jgi:hypothetical protein